MTCSDALNFDGGELRLILPAKLVGLSVRRLKHTKIESILLDFGSSKRLWIQCMPMDVGESDEIGVLILRMIDHKIEGEKEFPIEHKIIRKISKINVPYEDKEYFVGLRMECDGDAPCDVLCGRELCSLAVYGWGFEESDQISEFPLDDYIVKSVE